MSKKILLTGGHAGATAFALIEHIKSVDPDREIVFVGSKSAVEGKKVPTLENTYFPQMGIKYITIITGRIQRRFTVWTIPSILKIPVGFIHALIILIREKPGVTLSFGGHSAFPVVVISWLLGIPVILHEQTISAGRANIASSYFANSIALSRKESLKYFPAKKCVITGNPISKEIIKCQNKKIGHRKKTILITGGSRGSVTINNTVKVIIPKLINNFSIYHQTGKANFKEFDDLQKVIGKKPKHRYMPFPTVEMWKWYKYLDGSDLVISRSGANIVSELVYLGIPSILIPLPWSYKSEQLKNAEYAQSMGVGNIMEESDLNPSELYKKIIEISDNWENVVKSIKKPVIDDSTAAEKLYNIILKYEKNS